MKKLNIFAATLACAAFGISGVASADSLQVPDTYVYLGGHVGQYYYDFNSHEDNYGLTQTTLPGAQLGWRFSPRWSIQGSWERNEYSWDKTSGEGYLNISLFTTRYHYNDTSWFGFEPYAGLSVGDFKLDPKHNDEDDHQTVVGPQVGVQTMLLPYVALDLGAQTLWSADNERWDGEVYAGLNFIWSTSKSNDQTSEAPVVEAVVEDSDGDGVPNSLDQCPGTSSAVTVDAQGCNIDNDGDGVPGKLDQCPGTTEGVKVDAKGCELDSDSDGVVDSADQCPATPAGALVDQKGCQKVLTKDVNLELHVEFQLGKAVVRKTSYEEIQRVAKFAKHYPSADLQLDGYTDSSGAASLNKRLSKERANAVKTVLVDHYGVDASRISVAGYGEANPIADNSTADGRAQNRRVEVTVEAQVDEAQFQK